MCIQFFIDFQWFFSDFHWFSVIFSDFHLFLIDFHWFSLIAAEGSFLMREIQQPTNQPTTTSKLVLGDRVQCYNFHLASHQLSGYQVFYDVLYIICFKSVLLQGIPSNTTNTHMFIGIFSFFWEGKLCFLILFSPKPTLIRCSLCWWIPLLSGEKSFTLSGLFFLNFARFTRFTAVHHCCSRC